jgi:tight adherence protein C
MINQPRTHPARLRRRLVGTMLAGIAAAAMMLAIYAAVTVKRPDGARVKALNERREQLKAGIVKLRQKRRAHHRRTRPARQGARHPGALKVLQDEPDQEDPAEAGAGRHPQQGIGLRVIFARIVLPIVLGGIAAW